MAGSWRPPISEVHGLVPHGPAVRSIPVFSAQYSVVSKTGTPSLLTGEVKTDD